MISIDFSQLWTHVSLLELLIAALAGLQAGAFYAYSQRLGTHFFHSFTLSANFFSAVIVSSALVDRENWENWVGVWLLWLVFQAGVDLGYRIRVRRSGSSLKAH